MNLNDIAAVVSEDANLANAQAKTIVEAVFNQLRVAAVKGEEVSVPGFGKFKVQDKRARIARNPRTGENINVRATRKAGLPADQGAERRARELGVSGAER